MKLAIVGSTSLAGNAEAVAVIERVLDQYRPTLVISGGAEGIDTMAAEAAKRRGIEPLIFLPKYRSWPYYKARNMLIVEACEALVRIVASKSKTYGSGWTRDYAVKLGKPTEEHVIRV